MAYTRSSPVQSMIGFELHPRTFNVMNQEEERINFFAPPRPSATDGTIVISRAEYKAWKKQSAEQKG